MKPGVPIIIATATLENQTSGIPFTDLFTTPEGGNFRVSIYTQESGPAFSGTVVVAWADSSGTFGPFGVSAPIQSPSAGAMFHVPTNSTFKYEVSATPPSGSTYNAYIVLEDLNG